jgi:glycosyltransferase involved in cell wall biosynthesis
MDPAGRSVIRVLHVIDSLGNGGAEHQLTAMLLHSNRHTFDHHVCALGVADRFSARLREGGIAVHKFERQPRREPVGTLRQLQRLIRTLDPDVMHVSLYWASVLGRTAAHFARRPVVTSLVTTSYEPEQRLDNPYLTPAKIAVVRALDGITARRWGTWFVAVSEAVRASAVRRLHIPPDRMSVIARGVEIERFAPAPPARIAAARAVLGWDGAYPVLLTVGRLVPQKGQRYAIEAMPRILEKFPRALLVIAGEGRLRADLEARIRALGLQERVWLLGERHDVPTLLSAADIFVFPSLIEGSGGALLEALAAGCPSVATRIEPLREVTDNGRLAILVDLQSAFAVAEGVNRLAGDLLLAARLGDEARAWARERYDIAASARKFEAVFAAVAAGRPVNLEEVAVGAR